MITKAKNAPSELPKSKNYSTYRWTNGKAKVWFSASKMGNAISIHLCAKRRIDKLCLRDASNEFIEHLFNEFEWCRMIFCITFIKSTYNLALKCGFKWLIEREAIINGKIKKVSVLTRARA